MDDKWSKWLREGRFTEGGRNDSIWERLHTWREGVLEHAALTGDEVVLDVGAGDGLIGFGALDRLEQAGEVIFSDISAPVLARCRSRAAEQGVTDRCRFIQSPAEHLPLAAESVDIVTTRSVLVYVHQKEQALSEFHRVLRSGGRVSLFEPINSFDAVMSQRDHIIWGYDLSACPELVGQVNAAWRELYEPARENVASDFDERDLFRLVEAAGFDETQLELNAWNTFRKPGRAEDWTTFVQSAPNPHAPTLAEAMEKGLSAAEREEFVAHLRPLVESDTAPKLDKGAVAFAWAEKP